MRKTHVKNNPSPKWPAPLAQGIEGLAYPARWTIATGDLQGRFRA